MKKLLSIITAIIILSGILVFPASAQENTAEMTVKSTPNWIYDKELADKYVFPDYFTVGRKFVIRFSLQGIETLDFCEFDITFNSDVCRFESVAQYMVVVPDMIGIEPDETPVANAERISDGKIHISIDGNRNIKPAYFFVELVFSVTSRGNADFCVENTRLTDCDGKSYNVNVNTDRVPVKSLEKAEIPTVKLNFDKSLSYYYGSSNYVSTELKYPMTVSQVTEIVQVSGEKYEKIIVNDNGERLDGNEQVPTGARLVVLYDGVSVFVTNLILIGDVNGDAKINAADARDILRYSAKLDMQSMDAAELAAANVAKDRPEITAADARELLRYSAGIGQTYADWYEYHCVLKRFYPWLINDNIK